MSILTATPCSSSAIVMGLIPRRLLKDTAAHEGANQRNLNYPKGWLCTPQPLHRS